LSDVSDQSDRPVRIVCATRHSERDFHALSPLGKSLARDGCSDWELQLYAANTLGLGQVYNEAIASARHSSALLVFVHDDVWLCDNNWTSRVREGLDEYAVIGIAGNKRRLARQPGWALVDQALSWDARENLSGVVGRGEGPEPDGFNSYGPSGQAVKLLDGLLLAADSQTLLNADVRFDPQFKFHFYDMDFCRTCEAAQLSLGTWPLSVIHESGGDFGSLPWQVGYARYMKKWGE